nr:hypothetical protein [Streptomyces sp. S1D4-11]
MPLALALLLFVAAVAAAAPAVVETINATAPHARGAAVALYGCSMFIGASLGPQLTGALTGLGFGGILRVVAAALVLGVLLALLTSATTAPNDPEPDRLPPIQHSKAAAWALPPVTPPHGTGLLPTPVCPRGDGPARRASLLACD